MIIRQSIRARRTLIQSISPNIQCSRQPRLAFLYPSSCRTASTAGATQVATAEAQDEDDGAQEPFDLFKGAGDQAAKRRYELNRHTQQKTGHFGSTQTSIYEPYKNLLQPPYPHEVTLELLLASQSHLGHATSLWNPSNSQYIFGVRSGIHIISLEATAAHLRRACRVVQDVAYRAGIILFVGSRPGHERIVVAAARRSNNYHLFDWWTPGTLTNSQEILGGFKARLKVVDELDERQDGFEDQLAGKAAVKPDLVVCLNPLEYGVMLKECGRANVPTIGVIDTDANPAAVTYPIPANDDSLRCAQLIGGVLGRAAELGYRARMEAARKGEITFSATQELTAPTGKKLDDDDPFGSFGGQEGGEAEAEDVTPGVEGRA